MYNISHSRSNFKLGTPVRVGICCGIDSNKECTVINHFTPEDGYEKRLKESSNWIPVQEINTDHKFYMAANRLIIL